MSKLKNKIKRLDAKLNADAHEIHELHEEFEHKHTAGKLMIGMLVGGFGLGLVLGKKIPLKFKTLVKIPFRVSQIAATTKLLVDKFAPKK